MSALLQIRAAGEERIIPLATGTYGIGRHDDAAIRIDSRAVSRRHAELVVEGNAVRLIDLGSANGTEINGHPVRDMVLSDGDKITIGDIEITFRATGEAPAVRQDTNLSKVMALLPALRPRSLSVLLTAVYLLALESVVFTASLSFRAIYRTHLSAEAMARAQGITRYLAERNREDLRVGNELLLDVDSALSERGVRAAVIVDPKNRILAPFSRLNQVENDLFLTEAMTYTGTHALPPSPRLPDGTHIFVSPIRAYNARTGDYETLGAAKIVFSPADVLASSVQVDQLFLFLMMVCAGLAFLFGWATRRMLTQPILRMAEAVEGLRLESRAPQLRSPYREWRPLYDALERLNEDIGK